MAEHRPTQSQSLQPHTERSCRPGPELSSVEADVYVLRYALLVMHARKEEEEALKWDKRCLLPCCLHLVTIEKVLQCAGVVVSQLWTLGSCELGAPRLSQHSPPYCLPLDWCVGRVRRKTGHHTSRRVRSAVTLSAVRSWSVCRSQRPTTATCISFFMTTPGSHITFLHLCLFVCWVSMSLLLADQFTVLLWLLILLPLLLSSPLLLLGTTTTTTTSIYRSFS